LSCSLGERQALVLASTTSTEDTGLFGDILPLFEAEHPQYRVTVVAVGSGEAIAMAERGDADVLLVHSPAAEQKFMASGRGESRAAVMYNDFVILGDSADPAGIRSATSPANAFVRIADAKARFLSRGDQSGTHVRELSIWGLAARSPKPGSDNWYLEVGQGMAETARIAGEKRAYTLSDRATWLSLRDRLPLQVLFESRELRNPYSVIVVANAKNVAGARAFARWITSAPAQQRIAEFGRAQFGQPLFTPDAATQPRSGQSTTTTGR
jgi:tungstate transport system substrate-binding protein